MAQRFVWPALTHFHQRTRQGATAVPGLGIDVNQPTWAAATYRALAVNYLSVSRLPKLHTTKIKAAWITVKKYNSTKNGKKSKKDLKANPV
jgi:hypothetical protein